MILCEVNTDRYCVRVHSGKEIKTLEHLDEVMKRIAPRFAAGCLKERGVIKQREEKKEGVS